MSQATTNSLSIDRTDGDKGQPRHYDVTGTFNGQESVCEALDFDNLPLESQRTIIRVGLTNMLRDSMAGKAGDPVEARQALVDKIKRIVDGTLGAGASRGPRVDAETRTRNEYLDEVIANFCKAKGVAAPKGKEAIAQARLKVYEGNKAKVDAEVKRRLKAGSMELDIEI